MNTFLLLALCLGSLVVIVSDQASAVCVPVTQPPKMTCQTVKCTIGSQCEMIEGKPQCNCNHMCPMIVFPVCGTDGKTYSNECVLGIASCKQQGTIQIAHNGKCENDPPKPERDPCAIVRCGWGAQCRVVDGRAQCTCDVERCPNNIQGVCGSDGKTYASDCELRAAACRAKKDIEVAHQGACKQNCMRK